MPISLWTTAVTKIILTNLILVPLLSGTITIAQTPVVVPAKMLFTQPFTLTKAAEVAGIEGQISFEVEIDKEGKVTKIEFLAGPMWPCTSDPKREIKELKDAISKYIKETTFEPETSDGKARTAKVKLKLYLFKPSIPEIFDPVNAGLIFLSNAARDGFVVRRPEDSLKGEMPYVRMRRRPEPEFSDSLRSSVGKSKIEIGVRIDKTGKVLTAGGISGPSILFQDAIAAACRAEFEPLNTMGEQISQILTLSYYVNGYTPRNTQ